MSQLGLGVMINMLGGNEDTINALNEAKGKQIADITLDGSDLVITLDNGKIVTIWDDGQSCCEHRYMVCDDDLKLYIGDQIVDFALKDAPDGEDSGEVQHEIQFFEVITNKGVISVANHNEHNGYYGGFSIAAKLS